MNEELLSKLDSVRKDYSELRGTEFNYFYCPILFKDEDTELCKAHIVNKVFAASSRACTVQRADVDNFYGANFEADFITTLQYKEQDVSPILVLTDKTLSKQLNPEFNIVDTNDEKIPVGYFIAKNQVPAQFTPLKLQSDGKTILLGIKMSEQEFLAKSGAKLEIAIEKDARVSSLVSLIKSAHLTLFELLGYRYALSATGRYVGHNILGEFYITNNGLPRDQIQNNALNYFREYEHMVRPVQSDEHNLLGTLTDKVMYLCKGYQSRYWAWIVFVKTSKRLHAVLIPIFEQVEAVETSLRFLKNDNESIEVSSCRFENGRWEVEKNSRILKWPKTGILYPQ